MVLLPTIKVLLPTHGLCHVYGNRRENVVTAMVLLPTIKVLLPTHGLCHVYGNRSENVVTAMVLPPTIKVLNLPTAYAMYMEAGGKKCSYRYGATTQNKGDAITDMVPLTKQMGAYPIKINTMHI